MGKIKNGFASTGFTLIELIVVIGAIAISLPLIFSTFFIILQQQASLYGLQEAKKQGDSAMVILTETIRNNAFLIYDSSSVEKCNIANSAYTSSALYFKDKKNNQFGMGILTAGSPVKISSTSAATGLINLTSDAVSMNSFEISCSRTYAFTSPVVSISFDSRFGTLAPLKYKKKIKLRQN